MKKIATLRALGLSITAFIGVLGTASTSQAQIAAWELDGKSGDEATVNATTVDANLATPVLSRGAGVTASALGNSFSSSGWYVSNLATAVSGNKYFQFAIGAQAGYKASLSTLDVNFRRSGTGPNKFQWQYSLDGFATAGVNIGSEITYSGSGGNGTAQAQITLSGIPALQDVASGTTITIRLYGWGASASDGTFAIGRLPGNDLAIGGTVGSASATSLTATTLTAFGSKCINGTYGPNTFTITGSALTNANVTVGALSGYTYSTTAGGTYTSSLSLAQPGGAYSQTIYVKFDPVAVASYNGNIPVGGGGATSINVAASGSGVNTAPTVTTGAVSGITSASATVAGTLNTASSCGTVTAYGIEYSTTSGFTGGTGTAIPSTNLSGTSFSSNLTGLNPCTVYYTHAYATRASETTYGSQGTFTTAALAAPAATAATGIGANGFTANWGAVASATGYFLDVSTSPTFGSPGGELVGWNFTSTSTTATDGIAANLTKTISTNAGGTLTYSSSNNQLYLDGWDSGSNSKYWQISLVTTGYSNLSLSSIQQGSNSGPRDFKVQYRIGTGGAWTDVPSGTVTVANNITTGKLTNLALPAACDNQPDVYLRWIMTSNTSVNNGTVASGGNSRISAISVDATSQPSFVPGYNNLSVAGTTQSVSGLTPGTTYYYRVRAQATGCTSANSNVITVAMADAGCMDPLADNYNPTATVSDGSCTYCTPTITYNAPTPTPIVIGSGIPDQNMAVSTDCRDVKVGISAFNRYVGAIIPAANVYTTTTGYSPISQGNPAPDPVMARWNLLGTVDLGSFNFTNMNVFLDLDFDPAGTPVWNTVNISQQMIAGGMGALHVYQASENLAAAYWGTAFPGVSFDPTVPGTYDVRVRLESAFSNEPLVTLAIQVVVETPEITWYSQASGNVGDAIWATTPTGSAGTATFNATASMVVQAGHTVGATASTDVKKLTVESGATLALSSGTTFTVHGDEAIFDGALTAPDNSTLALAGSTATVLASDGGPLNLWNLTVNTPMGTLTDATIAIRGTLQLDAGELDASLADITLRSQAGGTGRLGPVGATASYTGNITMERYIPAGHTNWRMLGSPVGGQTVANWQDDFFTAGYPGSQYPNFYNPVNSNILWPSIRWYDETVVTNDANAGVVGVSSNLQSLAKGQGFLAWCGDNFSTTNAFTVNVTGAPYIAHTPVTLPMSFTSSGTVAADGWNLVSNPLPSPIDFTKLERGADVGNSYWIFDPVTGNNLAWSNGVGQGGLNGKIQSSQGFWLKAGGSATTTTVDESAKVSQPMGGTFGGDQAPALPLLNLTLASGINSFSDMATIAFAQGTPAYDAIDALKMTFRTPGAPQLGIRSSDNQLLAVDFFGSYSEAVTIPLQVDVDVTGSYTITAGISGINTLSCLSLTDLQTGAVTPLSDGASYSFSINADDDASLSRFVLHGSKPLPLVVDQAQCHGGQGAGTVVVPDGAPVDVTWADAFGNTLLTMQGIAGGIAEYEAPAGNYQVRITPGGACGALAADFTITQPEAIGADVLQTATTCPNSADGSIMVSGVTGGTAPYSFLWSNGGTTNSITGAAGTYTGTITDAAGCVDHVLAAIPAGEGVVAQFSVQGVAVAGTPVEFLNHTELGTDYAWDFGDGSSSGEMAPSHTYALPGVYTVTLSATGNSCYSTFSLDLTVEAATAVAAATAAPLAVWATPDNIVVEHSFGNAPVNVDVYDATGRLAMSQSRLVKPGRITLGDRSLNSGVWFVRITSGDVQRTFRVPLVR